VAPRVGLGGGGGASGAVHGQTDWDCGGLAGPVLENHIIRIPLSVSLEDLDGL